METKELFIRPIKEQKLVNLALRYAMAYKLDNKVMINKIKELIKQAK